MFRIVKIKIYVLFFLLSTVLSAQIPVTPFENNLDREKKIILNKMTNLPYKGVPGDLLVFGKNASVVLTGRDNLPVIAVSEYGKGKAVAFSHNSYFSREILDTPEGLQLSLNILQLTPGKDKKILCIRLKELADRLKSDYQNTVYSSKVPRNLDNYDVIFINIPYKYDSSFRDKQVQRLQDFVHNGGVLAAAAIGWVFIHYGEGKQGIPLKDFYGNKLFAPLGIAWGRKYASVKKGRFPLADSAGNEVHFLHIIRQALETINDPREISDFKGLRKELMQLANTLEQVPAIEYLLNKEQIDKIMEHFLQLADEIIPSGENPILNSDAEAAYLILLANAILKAPANTYTVPGLADDFPGTPGKGEEVTREIVIDTSIPRWHSTGLYAAPGAKIVVEVPQEAQKSGLGVQIGCHSDTLFHKESWSRWPDLITRESVTADKTAAANPHGGLVYITVPKGAEAKKITITISGALEAPYFVLGRTSPAEWKKSVNQSKAPWGEIASANIIITVPSDALRKLEDPAKVLMWWDRVVESIYELGGRRTRVGPERFVCDRQISAGSMHSGYPVMTHMNVSEFVLGLEGGTLYKEGDWGYFHELGHNNQHTDWTFDGTREVTVNLFTLYAMDKVVGITPHKHPALKEGYKKAKEYLEKGGSFKEWKKEFFLSLIMYVQLQKEFGWEPFQNVFAGYLLLSKDQRPKNDQEKRDMWMVLFSREVGYNLGPFFTMWRIPVSKEALQSIKKLPRWLPEPL